MWKIIFVCLTNQSERSPGGYMKIEIHAYVGNSMPVIWAGNTFPEPAHLNMCRMLPQCVILVKLFSQN